MYKWIYMYVHTYAYKNIRTVNDIYMCEDVRKRGRGLQARQSGCERHGIYIPMHIYTYTYIPIHIYTYIQMHTYVYIHIHICSLYEKLQNRGRVII